MLFQQITVDGRRYRWALSPDGNVVHIESALRQGQLLEVVVTSRWPMTASQVAAMVRQALRRGWKPSAADLPPLRLDQ